MAGLWRGVLAEAEDLPHLVEAIDAVLTRLGGVTRRWRFDRMSTVSAPSGRLNAGFAQVAKHYTVAVHVCPARHGNRKGVVEKANHAVAQRWWRTLREDVTPTQAQLLLDARTPVFDGRRRKLDGQPTTVGALAATEVLHPKPVRAYPAELVVARVVTAQALVSFRGNRYSVPPGMTGATMQVRHRLGESTIHIATASGVVLAVYRRAADGAGVLVRDSHHVTALETAVLHTFDASGRACTQNPAPTLHGHLDYLKLADAAQALPRILDDARANQHTVTATIEQLLRIEGDAVEARRANARMRSSCLPAPWTLADFDFAAQPGVDAKLIADLATLRFLDDAANVLFIGPPGVGKTMLAIALARAAIDAGVRVLFTTAADLAARCHKAALEGRWNTCMRFFAQPRLLIIDELGYLPLPADGAAALFQVINYRYLKNSTILTTNVGVGDWATAFGDATVERHLRHCLRQFELHYNEHRPHQAMRQTAPLRAIPAPITDPGRIAYLDICRNDRIGGIVHEYQHAA